ncbi:unnamed protein product [Rhizoctonia solani]|uniref:Uncharacterized protein n=1 Tax=Rhizoctonia solani TaxID=456999 RepID=A0A8H3GJK1_9AGAM|nr:unnamed protein product [Rhizoctonia solani]
MRFIQLRGLHLVEEDHWRYREVVMHDTHPMLVYAPPVSMNRLAGTPTWSTKVHSAEDGSIMSWHELESQDVYGGDQDQWGIKTKTTTRADAVYGVPGAYISNQDNLGFICAQLDLGFCEPCTSEQST